jgi:hypothetical protein
LKEGKKMIGKFFYCLTSCFLQKFDELFDGFGTVPKTQGCLHFSSVVVLQKSPK